QRGFGGDGHLGRTRGSGVAGSSPYLRDLPDLRSDNWPQAAAIKVSAVGRGDLARQLLVLHPVRNDAVLAEPAHLVLFVILKVDLEPFDLAVGFAGWHLGESGV